MSRKEAGLSLMGGEGMGGGQTGANDLASEILYYPFAEPPRDGLRPAIFFDRDGVINEQILGDYVTCWDEFRFLPGIAQVLAELARLPVPIIVISNQAGIGKGLMSAADLSAITHRFVAELAQTGARIDAAYYCPHITEQGCPCRKPKDELLRRAARDWRLDLTQSVFIGDSERDAVAARSAGCRPILLEGAHAIPDIPTLVRAALTERS